ncbi:CLUMA_CG015770, isoform A [Clunio marinus]|uniref:CLUMA_CG015770, isoform A n=1 Tax=Clunio marinus TaxID=568069 RepID=A0A1J1IWC7_9DIPT|nr:CLUMA_CG015770, isoform A [Clunio marinus]
MASSSHSSSSSRSESSSSRRSNLHIHKIREFELEKVHLMDEFDILQIVGEGWFGKILLVEHKATDTEMVLKALPKPYVSTQDFYREFHLGLCLGVHKNIVSTYDVAFETSGFYVFTQEYAPLGDLTSNVSDNGIGELHSKRVARQIAAALEYMHLKEICHRDVKLDNILVFRTDFSRVKLCDFGESKRVNTMVQRRNEWLPYTAPEIISTETDETYKTDFTHDIWQFGIVIFICLTGCLPWQKASMDDPRYNKYIQWHNSSFPIKRTPKLFKLISARASKMFRKFLEPKIERRIKSLNELHKYLDERWLARSAEKEMAEYEPDELNPSLYSFHSNMEEKNKLLYSFSQQGIETVVDRLAKKNRIKDWIQSSVITEEEELEEESSGSSTVSINMNRAPVVGHISSLRATEQEQKKVPLKDASAVQEGASQMGAPLILTRNRNNSPEIPPTKEASPKGVLIEHEEGKSINGRFDKNIKEGKFEGQYQQFNDFKHNYH